MLEADAEAYAEAERDVVATGAKDVPQGEAVVVARLGRGADGGACTCPSIDEETAEVGLIACRSQECAHLGLGAHTCVTLIVLVVDVDKLGTHVEAFEASLFVTGNEELVAVAHGVAARVVLELVVAGTDEAGAYLARLVVLEGSLVGEFGTACDP